MFDRRIPRLSSWDTGRNPFVFQGISEPIGIISPICEQEIGFRKRAEQRCCAGVVADLSRAQKEAQRLAMSIGQGVQFRVEAAFGAADQATAPPFLSRRLDAVLWAFR